MNDWTRPKILDWSTVEGSIAPEFSIQDLRHPILESRMGTNCIPSDFSTSRGRVSIITGPNTGGKSTFLRAVSLCTLLAHIGSFVPAKHAEIPLVDKILTRIGAHDSSIRGASTFMVEMQVEDWAL